MLAIIGGSGFEKFEGIETLGVVSADTPFGVASPGCKRVRVGSREALFLPRHGEHHELLPSEINYRANVFLLKSLGARAVVSVSAVGSLRTELKPGEMVIPLQYLDRTKGIRRHTFCGDGVVGHVSLAHPVCRPAAEGVVALARLEGLAAHLGGMYLCIEGPTFSTVAESLSYRDMGADIIGMTNFPEYALAREAGLAYLPLCFVTDYDCWDTDRPHVTLQEVIEVMRANNRKALALLQRVLNAEEDLFRGCRCADEGLKAGLMTPLPAVPREHRQWLDVLLM